MTRGASRLPRRLVLLGHPVAQSLSPAFQNAALVAAGLAVRYEAVDVPPAALPAVLTELRQNDVGGNVTIPHKIAVHASCDLLTPAASDIGAVNTFWCEDGRMTGDNTDVDGFEAAVGALLGLAAGDPWPSHLAVLGAGGAAAAVLVAARRRGVERVDLLVRSIHRAAALADRFPFVRLAPHGTIHPGASLVVNATPIGMRDAELPVAIAALPRDAAVLDLVYRPAETRWVREARAAGHSAADGMEMLIEQGAVAFRRWTGHPPDRAAMRGALAR